MKLLSVLLTLLLLLGASRLSIWMKRNRSLPADRERQLQLSAPAANGTSTANRFQYR